jgi:hypothetical protein
MHVAVGALRTKLTGLLRTVNCTGLRSLSRWLSTYPVTFIPWQDSQSKQDVELMLERILRLNYMESFPIRESSSEFLYIKRSRRCLLTTILDLFTRFT